MSIGTKKAFKDVERICITVPRKIRKKMLRFQKSNAVNWSEVASRAFSRYIREAKEEE